MTSARPSVTSLQNPPRLTRPSTTSTTSAALAIYGNYGKYNKTNKHPAIKSTNVSKRATKVIETSPVEEQKSEVENRERTFTDSSIGNNKKNF